MHNTVERPSLAAVHSIIQRNAEAVSEKVAAQTTAPYAAISENIPNEATVTPPSTPQPQRIEPIAEQLTATEELDSFSTSAASIRYVKVLEKAGIAFDLPLSQPEAERLIEKVITVYLQHNKRKQDAVRQVVRLRQFLLGASSEQIAEAEGTVTGQAISAGRTKLYGIVRRGLGQSDVLTPEDGLHDRISETHSTVNEINNLIDHQVQLEPESIETAAEGAAEAVLFMSDQPRYFDQLAQYAVDVGLSTEGAQALLDRLHEDIAPETIPLSQDIILDLHRTVFRNMRQLNFTPVEQKFAEYFLAINVSQGQRALPVCFITPRIQYLLKRENISMPEVIEGFFTKVNQLRHD